MPLHGARLRVISILLSCLLAPGAVAQPLQFPAPSNNAVAAAAAFDARAEAVIAFNACSREDDFLTYRNEMIAENFDHQGENLTSILIAKLAYVRGHGVQGTPCEGSIVRSRARNQDGTFVQPTLSAFADADRIARASGPTACAHETRETEQGETVIVELEVSPDCMLQQVNQAIQAMRKNGQLGSSDLPCIENLSDSSKGEFDVVDRELSRLLYLGGPSGRQPGLLTPETIDFMYANLLAARGAPSDDDYSVLGGCTDPAGDELGSPEDTADRHAWYNELAEAIGDYFSWALATFFRIAGSGLSSAAGLAAAPFLIAAGHDPGGLIVPHADIRVRETENHRLMIESSRYLTNADIIARLEAENYDHVDDVREDQRELRDWLMSRLQDIAAHDFHQYNPRPYTRYTLNAI